MCLCVISSIHRQTLYHHHHHPQQQRPRLTHASVKNQHRQTTSSVYLHREQLFATCYPHMPIGKVWIYRLLFVCLCVCVFVRLRVSPLGMKLVASNFSWRFIGVQSRESPIFVNFAPPEAQNRTNLRSHGPRPPARKHYRRDAPT